MAKTTNKCGKDNHGQVWRGTGMILAGIMEHIMAHPRCRRTIGLDRTNQHRSSGRFKKMNIVNVIVTSKKKHIRCSCIKVD
jgi:hypothetical protein